MELTGKENKVILKTSLLLKYLSVASRKYPNLNTPSPCFTPFCLTTLYQFALRLLPFYTTFTSFLFRFNALLAGLFPFI